MLAALLGCALAQYGGSYDRGYDRGYDHGQQQQGGYNSQQYVGPKVQILNHKQALGTDGSFNYAFNADNGIQQGESINPDGSRQVTFLFFGQPQFSGSDTQTKRESGQCAQLAALTNTNKYRLPGQRAVDFNFFSISELNADL